MPTTLLLMRHGLAEAGSYPNDSLRPLSEEGRQHQRRMALWIQKEGIFVEKILSSPLLRAKQSAEPIAEVFDIPMEAEVSLGDNFSLEILLGRLAEEEDAETLLLVGHEPTMGYLVQTFTGEGLGEGFSKSCVAIIRFPSAVRVGQGSLKRYLKLRECPVNPAN